VQWAGKRCSQTTCCQKETSHGLIQNHVINPAGKHTQAAEARFQKAEKMSEKKGITRKEIRKKFGTNRDRMGLIYIIKETMHQTGYFYVVRLSL
tara:strand:+ start:26433 stop:26714 length:282 start_codon:yes stop_codon:yes gene_type:complete